MSAWFRTFQKNLIKYNHIYSSRICCRLSKVWNLQTFYCFISFPVGPRAEVRVLSSAARNPPRPQYYHPLPRPALVLQSNKTNKQFCTGAWGLDSQDEKCCVLGARGLTEDQKQLASHLIMGGKPIVMATARIFRSSQETMTPITSTRTWLQKRISGT